MVGHSGGSVVRSFLRPSPRPTRAWTWRQTRSSCRGGDRMGGEGHCLWVGSSFSFNSNFLILLSHVRLLLTLLSLLLAMVAYQLLHCCYRHFRYFNLFGLSERYRYRFFSRFRHSKKEQQVPFAFLNLNHH